MATNLPSPALLSPSALPAKLTRKNSEKPCFARFRKALQDHTVCPKKPVEEGLPTAHWRGHNFTKLTEFAQWLEGRESGRRSSPLEDLLTEVYAEQDIALTVRDVVAGQTRCLVTFCILVEIDYASLLGAFQRAQVFDHNLPMSLVQLEAKVRGALRDHGSYDPDMARQLAAAFDEKQWKYFPAEFSMIGQVWAKNQVLPFIDCQLITDKGGTSTVYQVAVPNRFVRDDIKEKVASSIMPHPDFGELGDCCHFALKVFEGRNFSIFHDEILAYKMMANTANKGMLTYLGDFTLEDGNDMTHTIVLQYAEGDLTEYFYRTPPVLPEHISQFWKKLSTIAPTVRDLHEFKITRSDQEYTYEGWHADIKSDNIVFVDGQPKLADPGFAKFQRRKEESAGPRTSHQFTGGTTTYGAPERHASNDQVANPQASDMWSLGCVFSEAATWIVLGPSGIRQFQDLRHKAGGRQMRQDSSEMSSPSKRVRYDVFHNGKDVLPEVTEWHNFLRHARRPTDNLSEGILNLVDRRLLVADPGRRHRATDLCDWFDALWKEDTSSSLPEGISSAVRDAISVALKEEDRQLQKNLESQSLPARNAAKKDPTYLPVVGLTAPSKVSPPRGESGDDALQIGNSKANGINEGRDGIFQSDSTVQRLPDATSIQHSSNGQATSQTNKDRRYCVFHAHYIFMDKSLSNDQDEGDVKTAATWKRLGRGPKSKDKRLADYVKDRDLVFLMDNGSTMIDLWYEAVFVLEKLYNKCRGSDEDGVDLYFTCSTESVKDAKGDAGWKSFSTQVWNAATRPSPHARTNMQSALEGQLYPWLEEYKQRIIDIRKSRKLKDKLRDKLRDKFKDLTVIVLTDGIWQMHQNNPSAVDDAIVSFNKDFRKIFGEDEASRTVSIQFVSFGNDAVALERLRRLDDNLAQRGVPDIVDHEPSTGDVYKMLAGSMSEWLDSSNGTDKSSNGGPIASADTIMSHLLPVRSPSSRSMGGRLRHESSGSNGSQRPLTLSPQQTRDRLPSITKDMY